jgi:hypothetical protein
MDKNKKTKSKDEKQKTSQSNTNKEEKDKVNMTTVKTISGDTSQPGTRAHQYARGFGYNPKN